jgi:hypothetical protein
MITPVPIPFELAPSSEEEVLRYKVRKQAP